MLSSVEQDTGIVHVISFAYIVLHGPCGRLWLFMNARQNIGPAKVHGGSGILPENKFLPSDVSLFSS